MPDQCVLEFDNSPHAFLSLLHSLPTLHIKSEHLNRNQANTDPMDLFSSALNDPGRLTRHKRHG